MANMQLENATDSALLYQAPVFSEESNDEEDSNN